MMNRIDLDRDAGPVSNRIWFQKYLFSLEVRWQQTIRLLPPLNIRLESVKFVL